MRFVRRVLGCSLLIAAAFLIMPGACVPPSRVSAQNAGVVGIQAIQVPAFSAATANGCTGTLQDIGQGQNTLFITTAGAFSGTIHLADDAISDHGQFRLSVDCAGESTYFTISTRINSFLATFPTFGRASQITLAAIYPPGYNCHRWTDSFKLSRRR